ncbi:hypothetical protein AXK60_17820 [Tsukamurella pseudospumae]|uniref:Uncharacterized protein n=1 Tax=Tsukamurella pseudospumae TaxID=239498 RepID=A0A137ZZN9_9ACTN|nr:hypothetical protein AXK60_17820 [Tsukamurella pseudospumae]
MSIYDLRSQKPSFTISQQEVNSARIKGVAFFGDYLYIVNDSDKGTTYSVTTMSDRKQVATSWSSRPVLQVSGWTMIGDAASCGRSGQPECTRTMVRNVNGAFPGPWY